MRQLQNTKAIPLPPTSTTVFSLMSVRGALEIEIKSLSLFTAFLPLFLRKPQTFLFILCYYQSRKKRGGGRLSGGIWYFNSSRYRYFPPSSITIGKSYALQFQDTLVYVHGYISCPDIIIYGHWYISCWYDAPCHRGPE